MDRQECLAHITTRFASTIQSLLDAANGWPKEHWLFVAEHKTRQAMIQIGQEVLQCLIDREGRGHVGQWYQDRQGERRRFKEYRRRRVTTLLGPVEVRRARYCGESREVGDVYPLDKRLGLKGDYSEGVEEVVAFTAGQLPYEATGGLLLKTLGIKVSETKVQAVARSWGEEAVVRRGERLPKEMPRPAVAVSVDGAKVRTAKRRRKRQGSRKQHFEEHWAEAKLGAVFGFDREGKASLDRRYTASIQGKEVFGQGLWDRIVAAGADRSKEVVWLGDGAEWVWSLKEEHLPHAVEILDFQHVRDHVWTTAKAVWGEGRKRAARWAEKQMARLKESKAKVVVGELKRLSQKVGPPVAGGDPMDRRQIVADNVRYFTNNAGRMDYRRYRAKGYPIASGIVESGCRHVIAQRMRITASMSWSESMAEWVLQLRCLIRSKQWDDFWPFKGLVA